MNVLVVGAHYDDEILGCGGTILKRLDARDKVSTCIVTDSSSVQYAEDPAILREKERISKEIHDSLGIRHFSGSLPEMKTDISPIASVVKCINDSLDFDLPDVVYTHHPGDLNADHRRVFEATMVAFRPLVNHKPDVYCYEVPSTTEWFPIGGVPFVPAHFVDITPFLEKKLEIFSKYEMEVRDYPHPRSLEKIRSFAEWRGAAIQAQYAEAFEVARIVW